MNKPLFPDLVVNGQMIAAAEVAAEAQNHSAPSGKPGLAWRKAARALVIRALLLQRAARLGLQPQPQVVARGQTETDDEALIRAVLETGVNPQAVDDARLRAQYDANPDRFRAPTLYEAAHILFSAAPGDADARRKAHQRADAAMAVLHQRPDEFDALAQSQSDCSSRDMGGRLGQIGPGDTVAEFEAALDALETRYGVHIIRLDARAAGAVLPFDAVSDRLRVSLEKSAWLRAAHEFTNALVAGADISGIDLSQDLSGKPGQQLGNSYVNLLNINSISQPPASQIPQLESPVAGGPFIQHRLPGKAPSAGNSVPFRSISSPGVPPSSSQR